MARCQVDRQLILAKFTSVHNCLPKHIKEAVTERLSKHNRADVRSFVNFMNSEDLSGDYWQRFLAWTQRKDQFRKENFGEVFPELNSLIQQGITA